MSTVMHSFAVSVEPLAPEDHGDVAFERFEQSPGCPLLAVVDAQGRPIGQLERNTFLLTLGRLYGRAIFAHRPISLLMEPANLIVEAEADAADFAEMALQHNFSDLQRGFIVVEHELYLGVGGVIDLLHATTRERTEAARRLRHLSEQLHISNRKLQRQQIMADTVIENIPSLIALRSQADGKIRLLNSTGEAMLGVAGQDLIGRSVADISQPRLTKAIYKMDDLLAALPEATPRDLPYTPGPGQRQILRVMNIPVVMPDNGETFTLTIAEDVTEVRKATAKIEKLAHFDALTGLPNRLQLHNRLSDLMDHRSSDGPREVGLLTIDMDRFKFVNDTFGHHAGDMVLREMARRLRHALRPGDLPVRLGGDEFAVVISAALAGPLAEKIADRLIESMKQPFMIGDKVLHLGGSIGIAIYPGDCAEAPELMKYADMALYRAKSEGNGIWRRFSPDMREGLEQRNALEMDLHRAVAEGQLEVYLQPQLDIASGLIAGVECLMRWHHPEHGLVPPSTFIPVAEESGLINKLGEWMLYEACRIGTELPDNISLAVNISGVQFRMPGLVDCVKSALAHSGLSARRLELEITESVLIQDEDAVIKTIIQLRELGIRFALDDFGTGYASFRYLQRFAFDKIKIDQSFIRGLPHDPASRAIVSAVTVLGAQLGSVITAEGVETEAQFEALRQIGCTQAQGYLIGRPAAHPQEFLLAPRHTEQAA